MKPVTKRCFSNAKQLTDLINNYFAGIGIAASITQKYWKAPVIKKRGRPPKKAGDSPIKRKPPEYDPPTLAGLAIHLGFDSLEALQNYEATGKYATYVRRARLLIINAYENRLHTTYSAGAIFALKSISGWINDKPGEQNTSESGPILITVIESGPAPANNEKQVFLGTGAPPQC